MRRDRPLLFTLAGFSVAGGLSAGIDLLMFNILLFAGLSSTIASGSALVVALIANFMINRSTFAPELSTGLGRTRPAFRFALIAVLSSVFVFISFEIGVRFLSMGSPFEQSVLRLFVISIGSIARFLLYRSWVFVVN